VVSVDRGSPGSSHKESQVKLRSVVAVVVVAFALMAAACSSDESDGASDANDAAATDAEGSQDAGSDSDAAGDDATADEAAAAELDWAMSMGSPVDLENSESSNIAEIAAGTAVTQHLTRLVLLAGLLPTLRDGGPFTVFAPVDDAFAAVDPDTLRAVAHDPAQLASVLTLHVVPGEYPAEGLRSVAGTSLTTVQGGQLLVEVDGDDLIVGGATVAVPDIEASNGIVHAVDTVITAPNG
jgi:uncharacterized surface protein with fasciclin (FAS1) repeats